MNRLRLYIILFAAIALMAGCGKKHQQKTTEAPVPVAFSADSAYSYIDAQVAFGARVPGTDAHKNCYDYLRATLTRLGAEVSIQQGSLPNYEGKPQAIVNIIGHFNPQADRRILLCSHWDCRPWSDQEAETEKVMTPVLGANDGASGVGILLEIARQLQIMQQQGKTVPGIDIVFFDAEDMGTPDFLGKDDEKTWCLGSQLWATEYTRQRDLAQNDSTTSFRKIHFGILLDMVASPDAVFCKEYFSQKYASQYVSKIWQNAASLGYTHFFHSTETYPLTDDHYFVNTIANVPCVDIIHYDQESGTGFPEYWHTNHDNMQNVSRATIDAVGKVVLTTILQ